MAGTQTHETHARNFDKLAEGQRIWAGICREADEGARGRWGEGRGRSGEWREVIAGQMGKAEYGRVERQTSGQVKNNAEGGSDEAEEGWRGRMSRNVHS